MLRFTESLCVQCGLCAATCPENVIALEPQLDFAAWDAPAPRASRRRSRSTASPAASRSAPRAAIERVVAKLSGQALDVLGRRRASRVRVLQMCEDCRVEAVVNESFDPHAVPPRPAPRTTEDYLRERAQRTDET